MKRLRLVLALLALLAGTAFCGDQAKAQYGGAGFYGGAFGYGYGFADIGRLYRVLSQNVPYYAAFPPVYYSVPVPRTYGYSPFAYPPGFVTPEVVVEESVPEEIINPYVPSSVDSENQVDQVTSAVGGQPKVIFNPFVMDLDSGPRLVRLPK